MTSTTWQTDITSTDFLDAVLADHVQIDGHVEILDQAGATLATLGGPDATHPGPLECTVAWESGGHVAWSVDMTLVNSGDQRVVDNLRRAYFLSPRQVKACQLLADDEVMLVMPRRVVKLSVRPTPREFQLLFGGR